MTNPKKRTFDERFTHWITLLDDFNYDLNDAVLWLPKEYPDQLRDHLNALDQGSELGSRYLNDLFHSVVVRSFLSIASLDDEHHAQLFHSDLPLGDRVSLLLEHCPDGEQFTSMMMSRWRRFDQVLNHRHDDIETVRGHLFPNHSMMYIDMCPVFPELPDLLEKIIASGPERFPNAKDFYEHTLSIFAKDIRHLMRGGTLESEHVRDMSRIAMIPKPLRPMDQVIDALLEVRSDFSREMGARILNDYSVYDFETHLEKVNVLIDSFPSVSQQYTTLENITHNLIKDALFNERLLPMIAPDRLVAERVFLDAPISSPHDLMSTDYLITLINTHQYDPNGMLRQLDPNKNEDIERQQRFMVEIFAPRLDLILKHQSERTPDQYGYLRMLATLLRDTELDSTLQNIVNKTSPQAGFHVQFIDEAVSYIKPLLKKSHLDELLTPINGHTLHEDIVLIADLANQVADYTPSELDKIHLRSINKPLERMNGYVLERESCAAGLEGREIDPNDLFDNTL